jgi:hypothetical protein
MKLPAIRTSRRPCSLEMFRAACQKAKAIMNHESYVLLRLKMEFLVLALSIRFKLMASVYCIYRVFTNHDAGTGHSTFTFTFTTTQIHPKRSLSMEAHETHVFKVCALDRWLPTGLLGNCGWYPSWKTRTSWVPNA